METTKLSIKKLNQRLLDTNYIAQKAIENKMPKNEAVIEKTTTPNDGLPEKGNSINNWLNNSKDLYVGMYENQLKNRYDMYNALLNSFFKDSRKDWNPSVNYTKLFFDNNPFVKSMDTSMNEINKNENYYNEVGKSIDNMLKQMIEFDHNLFTVFNKEVQLAETNWNRSTEKFQKAIENRVQASREIIKTNMEILNKQLNKR